MKVPGKTSIILILALILSIGDGVATYIEASHKDFEEINWLPKIIQEKSGLENWLIFHVIFFTILTLLLAIALDEKFTPLIKLLYWKKIFWPVYFWITIEIVLLIIHLRLLVIFGWL